MIYSTRFYNGPATNGQTLYTCPANSVVVLRCVVWYNFSGGVLQELQIQLGVSGSTSGVLAFINSLAASSAGQWEGRSVVNPGESLVAFSTGASYSLVASGYLLS